MPFNHTPKRLCTHLDIESRQFYYYTTYDEVPTDTIVMYLVIINLRQIPTLKMPYTFIHL